MNQHRTSYVSCIEGIPFHSIHIPFYLTSFQPYYSSLITHHSSLVSQCVREVELKSLHGRKIAIDASMAIYQFLIAVRSGGPNHAATMLTNADGDTTSHIQGMFNRTIRFLTEGLKPVFVFDGKPPSFKSGELQKRREKRVKAQEQLSKAVEDGNVEEQDKHSKRLVRAGNKENLECQKLLHLMGVPVVLAPCEAEAQAAALAKSGQVYATATEDMDALTFATPVLVRKMTFANQSKSMVQTMNYAKAVEGLGLTHDQFVDLCILLGCDYCDSIRGIGPKTALKLIREHKDIETILNILDRKKFHVPENWEPAASKELKAAAAAAAAGAAEDQEDTDNEDTKEEETTKQEQQEQQVDEEEQDLTPVYVHARRLFNHHEVLENVELKWKLPEEEALTKFLVDECGFNPERVKSNIEKLQAAHKANAKPQARMDSFFAIKPNTNASSTKRKTNVTDEKTNKKKAKPGPVRKRR
jgi:flap endonuclease-1